MITIGILGKKINGTFGITKEYVNYFQLFDSYDVNIRFVNPLDRVVDENIDILVLPGGVDVDAQRYGAMPNTSNTRPDIFMEWFDVNMLPKYIERANNQEMSIAGICRGFQTLAVAGGGFLDQNIHQEYSIPRDKLTDDLTLLRDNIPWKVKDKNKLSVNSLHHQGISGVVTYRNSKKEVRFKGLPTPYLPVAYNKVYNNLEVFSNPAGNIFGFQYHPEELGYEYLSFNFFSLAFNRAKIRKEELEKENQNQLVAV